MKKKLARKVTFVAPQDGPPERLLKKELSSFLEPNTKVNRAYLAQVNLEGGVDLSVALCLSADSDADRPGIVTAVGRIYSHLFRGTEFLDILFLDSSQEANLAAVCSPFFVRASIHL
jgi:phosphomannomutase